MLAVARRLVSDEHIDLVVVGTHGRTGFRKLLMGSVAEEAERLLCCPVLTVGPSVDPETLTHGQFRSILYATDFSTGSQHALTYAVSFARESGTQLHMLHVMLEEMVTEFYLHDEMEHNCKERLARMILPGLLPTSPDVIVATGMPAGGNREAGHTHGCRSDCDGHSRGRLDGGTCFRAHSVVGGECGGCACALPGADGLRQGWLS